MDVTQPAPSRLGELQYEVASRWVAGESIGAIAQNMGKTSSNVKTLLTGAFRRCGFVGLSRVLTEEEKAERTAVLRESLKLPLLTRGVKEISHKTMDRYWATVADPEYYAKRSFVKVGSTLGGLR